MGRMAMIIVNPIVARLTNMLIDLAADEAVMLLGVRSEIEKLRRMLCNIQHVLADAEKRSIGDESIRYWLSQLKDVMYDADDILDECQVEAGRRKAVAPVGTHPSSSSSASVGCSFSPFSCFGKVVSDHQIGRRLRGLNQRLEEISSERSKFELRISAPTNGDSRLNTQNISRQTSPLPESNIVGDKIEEDAGKLVKLLTMEGAHENLLVCAVTGIGGIGKTTLAKRTYNDGKIRASFEIRLWLCVSQEFTDKGLLKDLMSQLGGDQSGAQSRAILEPMVESAIRGKRFLLVLDDVWGVEVWNELLCNVLRSGAAGSRILVTTRNEAVAMQMRAVNIHRMEQLPPNDGWALLRKVVFRGEEGEIFRGLEDVGMEIVTRCHGLPLAIKAIGGVLCTKNKTKRAWEEVLQSTAWSVTGLPEGVQGALYLSYMDLPPQIKQCFLYCSLFPEDSLYFQPFLVAVWISEGFVKVEGSLTLEASAEAYYEQLVQRCFLQLHPNYPSRLVCTMHDVLRSLGQFIMQEESLFLRDVRHGRASATTLKPRRLSACYSTKEDVKAITDSIRKPHSLRTILLAGSELEGKDTANVIRVSSPARVLNLNSAITCKLPDSVGNLVHLRYLDLSNCDITELPESIENLINLQFLVLFRCRHLCRLPKGVLKLCNLRLLDLYLSGVEGLPVGIGRLQHLNMLRGFAVGCNGVGLQQKQSGEWCTLEEVATLTQLAHLGIERLERAGIEAPDNRGVALLQNKWNLGLLILSCTEYDADGKDGLPYGEAEIKRIEEVFEVALCPPPSLEELHIRGFFGHRCPSWMTSDNMSLLHLRVLELVKWSLCRHLPPLGKLPNLESLRIDGLTAVVTIGPEFLGSKNIGSQTSVGDRGAQHPPSSSSSSSTLFPKLTRLEVGNMHNWEEWQWELENGMIGFPCLQDLEIENCPKLRSLPTGLGRHAASLKKLSLKGCKSIGALDGFSSATKLAIRNLSNLRTVSNFPQLEVLQLYDTKMELLPKWLFGEGEHKFPALEKLEITARTQLLRRCLTDGPDWPKISRFPRVYVQNERGSKYITKGPLAFNTNLRDEDDVEVLTGRMQSEKLVTAGPISQEKGGVKR